MSRMKLFALEDEMIGGVDETTGSESAAAAAVAEEVETEASSIEETASSVTDGIEATQELGEVKDVMDQSVEAGTGLDPVAAEMARISIRNILSKIGAESHANALMVASESFGSTSSRLANTRYASEGVGSFLKEVWQRIKVFFSNMWNKIKDFVTGLFNKEKALKGAIDRLLKKLGDAELSGKTKKISTKGKLGGFVFTSRTTLLNKAKISEFITRHSDAKKAISVAIKGADAATTLLVGNVPSQQQAEELFGTSFDNFKGLGAEKGASLVIPASDTFYGGLRAEIDTPKNGKFKGELIVALNMLNMVDSTHFKAEETELTGSTSDLKSLLNDVKNLIDGGNSLKKEGKILEDSIEKNIKVLTKQINSSTAEGESDEASKGREAVLAGLGLIKKAVGYTTRIYTVTASLNFKLAAAVVYYAEVCMFENSDRYVTQTEKD